MYAPHTNALNAHNDTNDFKVCMSYLFTNGRPPDHEKAVRGRYTRCPGTAKCGIVVTHAFEVKMIRDKMIKGRFSNNKTICVNLVICGSK